MDIGLHGEAYLNFGMYVQAWALDIKQYDNKQLLTNESQSAADPHDVYRGISTRAVAVRFRFASSEPYTASMEQGECVLVVWLVSACGASVV